MAWSSVIALALVLTLLLTCTGDARAQQTYAWDRDILYRTEPNATDAMKTRCKLDVYYPENTQDFVTVVFFHGGGLVGGEKYVPGELRNKGFAVVSANYRLSPEHRAPAYIEDAAAAVAWVAQNIQRYGGSPDKIILVGASAGGYLATMIALDTSYLDAHNFDANQLMGVASLSGQAITHVAVRAENNIPRDTPTVDQFAPLSHVRGDAPPLLVVTGDRELELLGRWEENALFCRYMKLKGAEDVTLYELGGYDHSELERNAHEHVVKFVERLSAKD